MVDALSAREVEAALDALVPRWIAERVAAAAPRYVGRDLTWAEWLALPEADAKAPTGVTDGTSRRVADFLARTLTPRG